MLVVENQKIFVDRVEIVYFAQAPGNGFAAISPIRLGQCLTKERVKRPPAAIVGTLIEIAVHDVDGQLGEKTAIVEGRGDDRLLEPADGLRKYVFHAQPGSADFRQQNF